jgi:hypothetical protein
LEIRAKICFFAVVFVVIAHKPVETPPRVCLLGFTIAVELIACNALVGNLVQNQAGALHDLRAPFVIVTNL